MNSFSLYTVSGGQTLFNIGFEYLRSAYLRVSINDVLTNDWALAGSGTQVDISAAGAINGDEVKIYRVTPVADDDRLVQWLDGAFLNQANLDTHQLQLLHSIQELIENPGETGTIFGVPAGGTEDQVLTKLSDTDYDYGWATAPGGGGGAVDSVFGRSGDVVAAASDYDASQVDNDAAGFTATDVAGALEELLAQAGVTSVFSRTGDVVAAAGDYDGTEVTVGSWAGGVHDYVTDALNFLFASKDDGDVSGPGSSGTRNICTFTDTTGKLIQDSGVEITASRVIQNILALSVTNASSTTPVFAANSGGALFDIRCGTLTPAGEGLVGANGDLFVETGGTGALWIKTASGWLDLTAATGAGDVSGPGSSTDNVIPRWDGVGGDTLQDSAASLSDVGKLSIENTDTAESGRELLATTFLDPADDLTVRGFSLWVGSDDPNELFDPVGTTLENAGDLYIRVDKAGLGNANKSEVFLHQRGDSWKQLLSKRVNFDDAWGYITNSSADNSDRPDTVQALELESLGTNGASVNFFVGDRSPYGQSFGFRGDVYFQKAASSSEFHGIFVKNQHSSWVPLLEKDSNEFGSDGAFPGSTSGKMWRMTNYNGTDNPDTDPILMLGSSGTNGALSEIHVGDRSPSGSVSNSPGSVYIQVDGISSQIWVNTGATVGTTWTAVGAGTGVTSDAGVSVAPGTVALYKSQDVITDEYYSADAVKHNVSSGEDGLNMGFLTLEHGQADTFPVVRMNGSGTNPGDADIYVGNRNPDTNISATAGDLYLDSLAGTLNINEGTSNWGRVLTTSNPQGARAYANTVSINYPSIIRNVSIPNFGTNPEDAIRWNAASGSTFLGPGWALEDVTGVGGGITDGLRWSGGRDLTCLVVVKIGLYETAFQTANPTFTNCSTGLALCYINGGIEAGATGYFPMRPFGNNSSGVSMGASNTRCSGAFSAVISIPDGAELRVGLVASHLGTGSNPSYFGAGCAITVVELASDED